MDKSVKRIRPTDFELSQIQDNLADCIQQLLDTANGAAALQAVLSPVLQQLRGPGTPQSVKTPALLIHGDASNSGMDVVTIGDPATATAAAVGAQVGITGNVNVRGNLNLFGLTTLNGYTVIRGNTVIYPATGNGVIITPPTTGPALYITNPSGTVALLIANGDGTLSCQAISSAAGFKNVIHCGTHWNSAYSANGINPIQQPVVNGSGNGIGTTPFFYKWSHAGSVVGASLNQAGPLNGINYLQIVKNGSVVYTWAAGSGGSNATFWGTFAKGVIPFAAGDTMTVQHYVNVSGNTQVSVYLTLEMAA